MKKLVPEVCAGTYFPLRGRPQRQYFIVLDENVLDGPFERKRDARAHLKQLLHCPPERLLVRSRPSKRPPPKYRRAIESVLREQEKALTAALGAAS